MNHMKKTMAPKSTKRIIFYSTFFCMMLIVNAMPVFYTDFVVKENNEGSVTMESILNYINSITTLTVDAAKVTIYEKT